MTLVSTKQDVHDISRPGKPARLSALFSTKEVMCPMRQASKTSAASSSARWKQPDSAWGLCSEL